MRFDLCTLVLVRLHYFIQCREKEAQHPSFASGENPLDAQLQVAAEYYLSVSGERLLQSLGLRLRSERVYRKLASSYTRSLCGFLLQWQMLRRTLGLFVDSYVNDYTSVDWIAPKELRSDPLDYIKITHVTTNSLIISWSVSQLLSKWAQTSNSYTLTARSVLVYSLQ